MKSLFLLSLVLKMENASCVFWYVNSDVFKEGLKVWKAVPYKDRQTIRNSLAQIRASEIREEISSESEWSLPYEGEVGWHAYSILKEGEILVAVQNDESHGITSCTIVKDFTPQLCGYLENHSVYNDICRGRPCLTHNNFRSFAFDWTGKVIFRSVEREANTLKTIDGRPDYNPIQRECPSDVRWEDPNFYWIDNVDQPKVSDIACDSESSLLPDDPIIEILSTLPKHHCKCQISAKRVDETTFMEVGIDIPKDDSKFDVQVVRDGLKAASYHEVKSLWTCWLPPDMPTVQIHCQSRFEANGSLTFKFFIQDDTPTDLIPFRVFKVGTEYLSGYHIKGKESWYNENHKKLSYSYSVSPNNESGKLWIYYGV